MKKRLLLWDIDGTLISTGAAGNRAIELATAERFGGSGDLEGVEIAGRTDSGIAQQILTKYGEPMTDENMRSFLDLYLKLLAQELPRSKGQVMPGVLELLERAEHRPDTTLGLLTGNLRRGAQLKLEHYQLWHFFAFGAFADDHHDRNELGAFALTRAQEERREIPARTGRRHRRHGARHRLRESVRRAHDRGRDGLVAAGKTGRIRSRFSLRRSLERGRRDRDFRAGDRLTRAGRVTSSPTLTAMSLPDAPNVLPLEGEIDLHVCPAHRCLPGGDGRGKARRAWWSIFRASLTSTVRV